LDAIEGRRGIAPVLREEGVAFPAEPLGDLGVLPDRIPVSPGFTSVTATRPVFGGDLERVASAAEGIARRVSIVARTGSGSRRVDPSRRPDPRARHREHKILK
jgi:hypothetical protein